MHVDREYVLTIHQEGLIEMQPAHIHDYFALIEQNNELVTHSKSDKVRL